MKKIVFFLATSLIFLSCEKNDEIVNENVEQNNLLKSVFGSSIVEYDAGIFITNTRTITPYVNEMTGSSLIIGADFNTENVGDVQINDIVLKADKEYNKTYSVEEIDIERNDVNSLYGNTVVVKNPTCSGSNFCGIDFNFNMTQRLSLDVDGLVEGKKFYQESDLIFNWNVVGNPNDLMALLIVSVEDVGNGNTYKQLLKTFTNSDGSIVVSGSELSQFDNNEQLKFILIRGNQYTYTTPSNKIVAVHGMDIVNYDGISFIK